MTNSSSALWLSPFQILTSSGNRTYLLPVPLLTRTINKHHCSTKLTITSTAKISTLFATRLRSIKWRIEILHILINLDHFQSRHEPIKKNLLWSILATQAQCLFRILTLLNHCHLSTTTVLETVGLVFKLHRKKKCYIFFKKIRQTRAYKHIQDYKNSFGLCDSCCINRLYFGWVSYTLNMRLHFFSNIRNALNKNIFFLIFPKNSVTIFLVNEKKCLYKL